MFHTFRCMQLEQTNYLVYIGIQFPKHMYTTLIRTKVLFNWMLPIKYSTAFASEILKK